MDTGCPGLGTIPPLTIASEQLVYIFCSSNGRYTDFAGRRRRIWNFYYCILPKIRRYQNRIYIGSLNLTFAIWHVSVVDLHWKSSKPYFIKLRICIDKFLFDVVPCINTLSCALGSIVTGVWSFLYVTKFIINTEYRMMLRICFKR